MMQMATRRGRTLAKTFWAGGLVVGLMGIAAGLFGAGCASEPAKVQRMGMVIGIKPEMIETYKELHANTWPGVLKKITESHIQNYAIYLKQVDDEHWYLFSYFEYTGDDFEADMKKMAADPETQRWWKQTDPCQIPIPKRKDGEQWANMEEVFFHE